MAAPTYTFVGLLANHSLMPEGRLALMYLLLQDDCTATFQKMMDELDLDIGEVHDAVNSLVYAQICTRDNRSAKVKPGNPWRQVVLQPGVDTSLAEGDALRQKVRGLQDQLHEAKQSEAKLKVQASALQETLDRAEASKAEAVAQAKIQAQEAVKAAVKKKAAAKKKVASKKAEPKKKAADD